MQRLGPYELVDELGRGAMGVVYRARHRVTGVERALKVIDASQADREGLARFKREAEALARVDKHPNLVRVHESGADGRLWYYAMELVRGTSLRKLLELGPLPTERAIELAAKLAHALGHCHANGVIHRDVKPENVLVDEKGEPRLVDFGLVRDMYKNRLTRTGDYLGTPAYMAAEQIRGEAATNETDIYALGMVAFESITGQRPYSGKTVTELSSQILDGDSASLGALRPELPDALAQLLRQCLSPDRTARPRSAEEVALALEGVLASLRTKTVVSSGNVRLLRHAFVALLAVALLLAVASGAVLVHRHRIQKAEARERAARRQSATLLSRAARLRAEARGSDAALWTETARAASEAAADLEADPLAARDLAVARALVAVARHEGGAVAAIDSAAALLEKGDETRGKLREARLVALVEEGDDDEALALLRAPDAQDLVRTRARLLFDRQRWDELDSLESTDDVVRALQQWSTWARRPVTETTLFDPAKVGKLQDSLRPLGAGYEEVKALVEIAVARAPSQAWMSLDDIERGMRHEVQVEIFERYAMAVDAAWRHGAPPHGDRIRQLGELTEVLNELGDKGYNFMASQLVSYLRTLSTFEAAGKLLAAPLPSREVSLYPLRTILLLSRLQAVTDGDKAKAQLGHLDQETRAEVVELRRVRDKLPAGIRGKLARALLYETERTLDPMTREEEPIARYLEDVEEFLAGNLEPFNRSHVTLTGGRANSDPTHYHRRAASIAARLASRRPPGPERDALLERARTHLDQAAEVAEKHKDNPLHPTFRRAIAEDSFYFALVRRDGKRLAELREEFRLDVPSPEASADHLECFIENLLVCGWARVRNDADEQRRCLERAVEASRRANLRGISFEGWYSFLSNGND